MLFTSSMEAAVAYPIFAQQNYANPREYTGKIVCANCHLASKTIDVKLPQAVLPDTIFKMEIEVPAKYAKRRQPLADGSKGPMNIGAIAVMPEGWKLAPKDRLPKPLKKEMKGLSWAPYSKEYPNIVVAGPVPGETYEKMVLPVLSPDPNTDDKHLGPLVVWMASKQQEYTLPKTNIDPDNGPLEECFSLPTVVFRVHVSLPGRIGLKKQCRATNAIIHSCTRHTVSLTCKDPLRQGHLLFRRQPWTWPGLP